MMTPHRHLSKHTRKRVSSTTHKTFPEKKQTNKHRLSLSLCESTFVAKKKRVAVEVKALEEEEEDDDDDKEEEEEEEEGLLLVETFWRL